MAALIENAANLASITIERRRADDKRHVASLIYQRSSEAMLVTDARSHVLAINPAFTGIFGYEADEICGRTPKILLSNKHDDNFFHRVLQKIAATGGWQGGLWGVEKMARPFRSG